MAAASMNLQINDDAMRQAISAAIIAQISTESRDELIQTAINHLVAPRKTDAWRGDSLPSPLEEAFTRAVEIYANTAVREWIETNDEVKALIEGKLSELFATYVQGLSESDELTSKLNAAVLAYGMEKARERW